MNISRLSRKLQVVVVSIITLMLVTLNLPTPKPVVAQQTTQSCDQLLKKIETSVTASCNTVGNDEVCYGHRLVNVDTGGVSTVAFTNEGDRISLKEIRSVLPGPLNLNRGEWGVALFKVLTSALTTGNEVPVMFVVYGDTALTNPNVQPPAAIDSTSLTAQCFGETARSTSLRALPDAKAGEIELMETGAEVGIAAISSDGAWVLALNGDKAGWVQLRDLNLSCNLSTLPINETKGVTANETNGNAQFTLDVGPGISTCQNIPANGATIQVPAGEESSIQLNGVDIKSNKSGQATTIGVNVQVAGTNVPQTAIKWVLTGSDDNTARIWIASNGQLYRQLEGHTGPVLGVAFSPDGTRALTGSADNTMKLWNTGTGREVRTFTGHTAPVNSVAFSPDGRLVLSGSSDGTARIWNINSGETVLVITTQGQGILSVAFSPDGKQILTGNEAGTAELWDAKTGASLGLFSNHSGPLRSALFSPNGRFILTSDEDRTSQLWDIASGQSIRTFADQVAKFMRGTVTLDGRFVLTVDNQSGVKLRNAVTTEVVRDFKGHQGSVNGLALAIDRRYFVAGGDDMIARLWDMATGESVRTFNGHTGPIRSVDVYSGRPPRPVTDDTPTCINQLADDDGSAINMNITSYTGAAQVSVGGTGITISPGQTATVVMCQTEDGLVPGTPPKRGRPQIPPPMICRIYAAARLPFCRTTPRATVGPTLPPPPVQCPAGQVYNAATGQCETQQCDLRDQRNIIINGVCTQCPSGKLRNNENVCVCPQNCGQGMINVDVNGQCTCTQQSTPYTRPPG